MSCGCGTVGCGGSPCTTAPRDTVFTIESPQRFANSLSRLLISPVDAIRDIATQFGVRPYIVRLVYTQWSGGARGIGEESVLGEPERILPTPLVLDILTLTPIVSPVGADEQRGCLLTEVSGCYTEEQLRGLGSDGSEVPANQSFYYEIEFLRADGVKSERRRFNANSAPAYSADDAQWQVRLERARPDRTRHGAPR